MIPRFFNSLAFRAAAMVFLAGRILACPAAAADKFDKSDKTVKPDTPATKPAPLPKTILLPMATPAPSLAEAAIRATAKEYTAAFDRGDAAALAAMFTPAASVADDEGQILHGQTAIRDEYARLFKAYPGAKVVVAIKSVEFPAPEMAIEDGLTQVSAEQVGPPVISRYTVCHVLMNGKWLMASVRESRVRLASNHSRVEDLDWLVGTWRAERDGKSAVSKIYWIANKSFLARDYKVSVDGIQVSGGRQIVGWDPNAGKLRSWSFDASGGYGTGLWTPTPDGWQIETTGVLADGTPTSSRDTLIRVPGADNVFGWKSVARTMGEVSLSDTPEVVFDRLVEKSVEKSVEKNVKKK